MLIRLNMVNGICWYAHNWIRGKSVVDYLTPANLDFIIRGFNMLDWIWDNKEWIFSGIGMTLIGWLFLRKNTTANVQKIISFIARDITQRNNSNDK